MSEMNKKKKNAKSKNYKKKKLSIDERIESSKFNFCKNLKWFLIAPIVIVLVGVVLLCTVGFNLGIDFTGGTVMTIYVDSKGTYSSQTYSSDNLGEIEDVVNGVLSEYGLSVSTIQTSTMTAKELGLSDAEAVLVKYQNDNSLKTSEIEDVNDQIRLKLLIAFGFVDSSSVDVDHFDYDDGFDELDYAALVSNGGVTTASASSELLMNSFIALLVAVVIILIYVALRFEITSGLAAILALFHDILVTTAVVLICRIEINVSFIAALVTILGYSINNTIIIFDRMRDEVKTLTQSGVKIKPSDNEAIANHSVRQTLTRSVLTTATTFIMVFMITVIGVADIREFAFPIMVGILAGFYSSVFITPGLWAIAFKPKKRKKKKNASGKDAKGAKASAQQPKTSIGAAENAEGDENYQNADAEIVDVQDTETIVG